MNKIEVDLLHFSEAGANLDWIDYHYKGFPLIATQICLIYKLISKRLKVML
jgi:hypothetical protein